ncbi:lytic polysaccharide monooxygenase [Flavobacterium sp. PL02]|uniref:lytic polysaccharide monooxygenase n=1 Tax=Flavobacterium sp. PL02 TaxID=3088354 RepID=UPI002B23B9E7|nr:lytic polysaccharide monooxygenase [Flavobacterium sp. PL02]MEA9412817.1 lytic polysaccharide monooxygenase [Flavobacterium sp. PL02]
MQEAKLKTVKKTRHGYAFNTRGRLAYDLGWLLDWNINQFEGGKFFTTIVSSGLDKYPQDEQGGPHTRPVPPDNYINSGGWTNESGSDWDIVNCTDRELQAKKGQVWPKTKVNSGQNFRMRWSYNAPHATRGYNHWITKDGWNPDERITRDQLEPVPFNMHHYATPLPYGAAPTETSVVLPQKKGHHVMIVAWIVSDTAHAFYQTFDLDFDDSENPEPAPIVNITPNEVEVEKGNTAFFSCSAEGEAPFTYLWNLPSGLGSSGNSLDKENVTYTTDNVVGNKRFDITCKVTDKNGKTTEAYADLIVKDSSVPSLPTLEIMPALLTVKKGVDAKFNAMVSDGEGPFTYKWNLPDPLTSPDIDHNMFHITYVTANVENHRVFDITCTVTDSKNQTATAVAKLTVLQDDPEPGKCVDDTAGDYPVWNSTIAYPGERTHKVSYKGLVWENKHYINPGELQPDINDSWKLISNIATIWNNIRSYEANSYVNHNHSQWKASYQAEPGNEPGSSTGSMWQDLGSEACEPKS